MPLFIQTWQLDLPGYSVVDLTWLRFDWQHCFELDAESEGDQGMLDVVFEDNRASTLAQAHVVRFFKNYLALSLIKVVPTIIHANMNCSLGYDHCTCLLTIHFNLHNLSQE